MATLADFMIEDDFDLREFNNQTRLFPLANVVMFPHVVLPLHIFEPRYRQMTEDALAGDRLITIIQTRPFPPGKLPTEPIPLEEVGCLGKIIQHERMADGRFNFLLLGRKRVKVRRELPSGKLYRSAEVELLEDKMPEHDEETKRAHLIGLFRRVFEKSQRLDSDLASLLDTAVPLGVLTDIVAHALNLPAQAKQCLLAETSVDARADTIRSILSRIVEDVEPARQFPPPFSEN